MIALIEDAIKARLAAAGLPYLRTVATYSGQFDADLSQVARAFPAAWVVWKGDGPGKATSTSRATHHVPCTFLVMAGARNLRSEEAGRKGGPSALEIGTYQMLADFRALLLGQDLGLDISPLAPGRASVLVNGKTQAQAVSILGQEWHTTYALRAARLREGADVSAPGLPPGAGTEAGAAVPGGSGHVRLPVLPLLERVGLDYHLLPDDGRPDALDLLTLQEGREDA